MKNQTIFNGRIDPYEPRKGVDKGVLYDEVASRIVLPDNLPYLVYGIGMARSGTTVSLNVMTSSQVSDQEGGHFPIHAGYQHFKAGFRHAMHDWPNDTDEKRWQFEIPDATESPAFYIKDPLGPYTETESTYNPLELLQRIGYPQDKLSLVFFFRDPSEILASWKRNWGGVRDPEILRNNLITASHTLHGIREQAEREGYDNQTYLYESIRDHAPEVAIGRMFDRINRHMKPNTGLEISLTDHSVGGWDTEEKKRIWHPDEPAIYTRDEISELHSAAKTSDKLSYKKYSSEALAGLLTPADTNALAQSGVFNDYGYFRRHYIESSGLMIRPLDPEIGQVREGVRRAKEK